MIPSYFLSTKDEQKEKESQVEKIMNKPVATLAGFKGLWRECTFQYNTHTTSSGKDARKKSHKEAPIICDGQKCDCTYYWSVWTDMVDFLGKFLVSFQT